MTLRIKFESMFTLLSSFFFFAYGWPVLPLDWCGFLQSVGFSFPLFIYLFLLWFFFTSILKWNVWKKKIKEKKENFGFMEEINLSGLYNFFTWYMLKSWNFAASLGVAPPSISLGYTNLSVAYCCMNYQEMGIGHFSKIAAATVLKTLILSLIMFGTYQILERRVSAKFI